MEGNPNARRWLGARPRTFGRGILVSIALHLGLAAAVVLVWSMIPGPPMRPVKITTYRNAPTRESLGLTGDGDPRNTPAAAPSPAPSGSGTGTTPP